MSSTRGSSFLGLVKPIQLVSTWGQGLTFISRDMRGQKYGNWRTVLQVESIQTHNVYGQTSGAQCCSGGFCPCSLTPLSKFTRTCVITCASLMFLLADGTNRLRIGEHWHRLTPPVSLPLTRSKTLIIFHPSLRRPRTSVSRPLFEQWPRVLWRVEEPETWSYSLLVIGEMFAELWGRCCPPSLDSFAKQNLYTYDPYFTNWDILRQQLWSVTFSNDRRGERVRLWLLNVTFNPGMEQDLQDMWGRPSERERESRSSTWPTTQSQLPPTAWCAELLKASFGCKCKLTVLMWVYVSGADKLESSVWKVTTVPFDTFYFWDSLNAKTNPPRCRRTCKQMKSRLRHTCRRHIIQRTLSVHVPTWCCCHFQSYHVIVLSREIHLFFWAWGKKLLPWLGLSQMTSYFSQSQNVMLDVNSWTNEVSLPTEVKSFVTSLISRNNCAERNAMRSASGEQHICTPSQIAAERRR